MANTSAPETALRDDVRNQLNDIEQADIILGIPAFQSEDTIGYVVETLASGVVEVFPDKDAVILVADGGSLDDTREEALEASVPDQVEKLVTIYRGIAGKGTALRAIFEAGASLGVDAGMVVDSDMRNWPPEWTRRHLSPVFDESMDLMTPLYRRHKYDATITNSVCFPVTSALYGRWVRQPIGGDFGISGDLMEYYSEQDEWGTDVAKFGIDIWMTTTALCEGFNVGQTNLGAKVHDSKDPGEALGPMFREVVGTLFRLVGRYEDQWLNTETIEEAPIFFDAMDAEPETVPVNRPGLREKSLKLWKQNKETIRNCLDTTTFEVVENVMVSLQKKESILSFLTPKTWAHVLFDYMVAYNFSSLNNDEIMNSLIPLYFTRTWTLYHEMDPLVADEAETYIRELVDVFSNEKDYLRRRWREVQR